MSEQNKPQQPQPSNPNASNQPKKQDDTHKHALNQGPDLGAPGRPDYERSPQNPKIQAPQK